MLQGLVVGRWVPCDHILLINLHSKMLRLRSSVSEMWMSAQEIWTSKVRKGAKETIEILSVNTILFTQRRCSIWPPSTSIHFVYRLIISCRTVGNISGILRITPAATRIRAIRSCCVHGNFVHQGFHVPPEMEIQWCQVRSSRGQTIGAPRPIPRLSKVSLKWRHNKILQHETEIRETPSIFGRIFSACL